MIPGIGPVLAAGPLAAALMAGIGAASGAVTGGIVAGLVDFGVPPEHAETYAEGVRRGGTLVTVHITQDEWADRAQSVLNRYNPVDISARSGDWRANGWAGYDETAAPLSADQIRQQSQVGGGTTAAATTTTFQPYSHYEPQFRTNYNLNYVDSGYDYSVYDPAYRYGYTLATDPRYDHYTWAQVEPEAERYWVRHYPNSDWDRVKNAIRDAWEDVTGR